MGDTYYVKLTPAAGGRLIQVTNVETYTLETKEDCPDELYRDIFSDASADYAATPNDGDDTTTADTFARVSDDKMHELPRQATKDRMYHKFVVTGKSPLMFWDEFVVGVTNSNA